MELQATIFNDLAFASLEDGDRLRAVHLLQEAAEAWDVVGRTRERALVLRKRGLLCVELSRFKDACRCLLEAVDAWERLRDPRELAETSWMLAKSAEQAGFEDRAMASYERAVEAWAELDDEQHRCAKGLHAIAAIHDRAGRLEAAVRALEQARAAWADAGIVEGMARAEQEIGDAWLSRGARERALECWERAYGFWAQSEPCGPSALLATRAGTLCRDLGASGRASEHFAEALRIADLCEVPASVVAYAANVLGHLHSEAGELASAVDAYQRARGAWRSAGERVDEAGALRDLAGTLADLGHVEESARRYRDAITVSAGAGDRNGERSARNDLGFLHHSAGRHSAAQAQFRLAIAIRGDDRQGEAVARSNLAHSLLAAGSAGEAVAELRHAVLLFEQAGDDEHAHVCQGVLAVACQNAGLHQDAVTEATGFLAVARESTDPKLELSVRGAFQSSLEALNRTSEAAAAAAAIAALAHEVGDSESEARALIRLASCRHVLKEHQGAAECGRQALDLAARLDDLYLQIHAQAVVSNALFEHGASIEARDGLDALVRLAQRAGDAELESAAVLRVAIADARAGDTVAALAAYARVEDTLPGNADQARVAKLIGELADALYFAGERERALGLHQRALESAEEAGDLELIAEQLDRRALAERWFGFSNAGEFDALKALVLAKATNNARLEASALRNLAAVATASNPEGSLEQLERALELEHDAGSTAGAAVTLHQIGYARAAHGDHDGAAEAHSRALAFLDDSSQPRSDCLEGWLRYGLGIALAELKRGGEAMKELERALALLRDAGHYEGEIDALHALARVHRNRGEPETALEQFEQAVARVEGSRSGISAFDLRQGYFSRRHDLYVDFVALLATSGHPARAFEIAELARARTVLDLVAAAARAEDAHASGQLEAKERALVARSRQLTEFKGAAERGDLPATGRRKQRSLWEGWPREPGREASSSGSSRSLSGDWTPSVKPSHEASSPLRRGGRRQAGRSGFDFSLVTKPGQELNELEQEFLYFQAASAGADNDRDMLALRRAARAVPGSQAWSFAEVRRRLDPDTALLQYVLGAQESVLFCVTAGGSEPQSFPLPPRVEVERMIREQRAAIVHGKELGLGRYPHGHALYRVLVEPAAALIEGKNLLICPDGELNHLPFALLLTDMPEAGEPELAGRGEPSGPVEQGGEWSEMAYLTSLAASETNSGSPSFDWRRLPYLLKDHAIRYAPSATLAAVLDEELQRRGAPDEHYDKTLCAIACPLRDGLQDHDHVPQTAVEAEAIRELFSDIGPGNGRVPSIDPRPTKRSVRSMISGDGVPSVRFLHFATHGVLDDERPELSGLVLTPENDADKDHCLHAFEVMHGRMPSELVTLSGCETGLGALVHGEGLVGLSRAFFASGTLSVCASLWRADDASTAALMGAFYQQLKAEVPRAIALRKAQLGMLDGPFAHASYWAAFVVQGA